MGHNLADYQRDEIISADSLSTKHVGAKLRLIIPVDRDEYSSLYNSRPDRATVTEGTLTSFRVEEKTIEVSLSTKNPITLSLRHDHLIHVEPKTVLDRHLNLHQDPNRR